MKETDNIPVRESDEALTLHLKGMLFLGARVLAGLNSKVYGLVYNTEKTRTELDLMKMIIPPATRLSSFLGSDVTELSQASLVDTERLLAEQTGKQNESLLSLSEHTKAANERFLGLNVVVTPKRELLPSDWRTEEFSRTGMRRRYPLRDNPSIRGTLVGLNPMLTINDAMKFLKQGVAIEDVAQIPSVVVRPYGPLGRIATAWDTWDVVIPALVPSGDNGSLTPAFDIRQVGESRRNIDPSNKLLDSSYGRLKRLANIALGNYTES